MLPIVHSKARMRGKRADFLQLHLKHKNLKSPKQPEMAMVQKFTSDPSNSDSGHYRFKRVRIIYS